MKTLNIIFLFLTSFSFGQYVNEKTIYVSSYDDVRGINLRAESHRLYNKGVELLLEDKVGEALEYFLSANKLNWDKSLFDDDGYNIFSHVNMILMQQYGIGTPKDTDLNALKELLEYNAAIEGAKFGLGVIAWKQNDTIKAREYFSQISSSSTIDFMTNYLKNVGNFSNEDKLVGFEKLKLASTEKNTMAMYAEAKLLLNQNKIKEAIYNLIPLIVDNAPQYMTGLDSMKAESKIIFADAFLNDLMDFSEFTQYDFEKIYNAYSNLLLKKSFIPQAYLEIVKQEELNSIYRMSLVQKIYTMALTAELKTDPKERLLQLSIPVNILREYKMIMPKYFVGTDKLWSYTKLNNQFEKDSINEHDFLIEIESNDAKNNLKAVDNMTKSQITKAEINDYEVLAVEGVVNNFNSFIAFAEKNPFPNGPSLIELKEGKKKMDAELIRRKALLAEVLNDQEEAKQKAIRKSNRYVLLAGIQLGPLVPMPEVDYVGHLDFRKKRHAHSFEFGVLNGKLAYANRVAWKGQQFGYAYKRIMNSGNYYWSLSATYSQRNYFASTFKAAIPDSLLTVSPTEVSKLTNNRIGLCINIGNQGVGKVLFYDWYMGIGVAQNAFSASRSGVNVTYSNTNKSTFEDLISYNSRTQDKFYGVYFRAGISIGITNNWNRH